MSDFFPPFSPLCTERCLCATHRRRSPQPSNLNDPSTTPAHPLQATLTFLWLAPAGSPPRATTPMLSGRLAHPHRCPPRADSTSTGCALRPISSACPSSPTLDIVVATSENPGEPRLHATAAADRPQPSIANNSSHPSDLQRTMTIKSHHTPSSA